MKHTVSLSLTGKHWILPEDGGGALDNSCIAARLLAQRGIEEGVRLTDPFVYPDMRKATGRIRAAIDAKERIGIFGDYDCDGVTSTAQLVRYFRRHGSEPYVRLPHRVRDGYGLNAAAAQEIIDAGVQLLLTCDTGIASAREISMLAEHGIDVIVTDHHHPCNQPEDAYAIIHPALSAHSHPHPCGAGVVFSLISALEGNNWDGLREDLALAMLGTVADLVELRGSNRAMTLLGLNALQSITHGPLAQLRDRCVSQGAILTSTDIAFRIAPRINAAGRMEDADIALRALLEGGDVIDHIDRLNEQRRETTGVLLEHALSESDSMDCSVLLMTMSEKYPHGIVGLIAGKLTETYGKPSLVAHRDGSVCTASLRSPPAYNVAKGLARCSDLLQSFGGHAQAAGCTFDACNADLLRERLSEDIAAHAEESLLVPTISIDAQLAAGDITARLIRSLSTLQPYGQGNAEPVFLLRGIRLENGRACGGDLSHLQARIGGIKSIGFGLAKHLQTDACDIVCTLGIDTWNGREEPQIFIKDIRRG